MLPKVEYESSMVVIEEIYGEVGRLTYACKQYDKVLQIYDEKEKNCNEEITIVRTQLAELKKNEEFNCSKKKNRMDMLKHLNM